MSKKQFLEHLKTEFTEYDAIPDQEFESKTKKKEFIKGMMKASRYFGVSFYELESVVVSVQGQDDNVKTAASSMDYLDIPTIIRLSGKKASS